MIKRPSEALPLPSMLAEYRRLAALPPPIVSVRMLEPPNFQCHWNVNTWLRPMCPTGADILSVLSAVEWLRDGPKIVRVTKEQYQALAQVEVRLELNDFTMPYQAVLVDLSDCGGLHYACLAHRAEDGLLSLVSYSKDHKDDITTAIYQHDGRFVEASLEKFDDAAADVAAATCQTLRVTCNMLLALTNFGCQAKLIFPDEARRDRRLAAEQNDRGRRAVVRLREAPQEITFWREVVLHHTEGSRPKSDTTGKEMPFHWRRGHWKMVAHGPHHSLRKRAFIPPCMVRADLLTVEKSDTETIYR